MANTNGASLKQLSDNGPDGASTGTVASDKAGFHGDISTQYNATIGNGQFNIGTGAALTIDTLFRGASGGGYTAGDIVEALKAKGILDRSGGVPSGT